MGEGAPQGLAPRRIWEDLGEGVQKVCARSCCMFWCKNVKKCKKNAKKCKNICIYQKKAVPL